MDESNKNQSVDETERQRMAREKFDRNYMEFRNKKITEAPCVRSTFLTSRFIQIKRSLSFL